MPERRKLAGLKRSAWPTKELFSVSGVNRLTAGINVSVLAREFKTTRQTIMRIRDAALKSQESDNKVHSSGE